MKWPHLCKGNWKPKTGKQRGIKSLSLIPTPRTAKHPTPFTPEHDKKVIDRGAYRLAPLASIVEDGKFKNVI